VLLVAPSGFGKTSLLGQWATTTEAEVVPSSVELRWRPLDHQAAF
jgi:ATP/maltotriose-dependent transcriptional regulator MalT